MTNHLDGASTHRSGRDPAGTVCLQFMGGGRMGEALFAGLIASGAEQAETIVVVEPLAVRRDELRTAHPGLVVSDAPVSAPTVVAVKPQDVRAAVGAAGAGTGVAVGGTNTAVGGGAGMSPATATASTPSAVTKLAKTQPVWPLKLI